MKEDFFSLPDELQELIFRSVFTALIALFVFFEIYHTVDDELITAGNIITVIVTGISLNALILLYRRVKLFILPALLLVGIVFYLAADKNDIPAMMESTTFSLILIGLAAFTAFIACDRFMPLNILLAGGALIYLISGMVMELDIHAASPVLVCVYVLAAAVRLLRDGISSRDLKRTRKYVVFLLPFLMGFGLFMLMLPKPEKPISWKWVVRLYDKATEQIEKLVHGLTTRYGKLDSEYFSVTFGMDERMTYNNDRNNSELFEAKVNGGAIGSLYLRGEIFNRFSDGAWHNTLTERDNYTMTDAVETRRGVDGYEKVPYDSLVREASVMIRFLDIISPIVFSPAKLTSFADISTNKKTYGENEHLLFNDRATYGEGYSVTYLQMNYGNTVFTEYMNEPVDPEKLKYDGMDGYREYVYRNYVSEPEISTPVKNWLESVIKGKETGYEQLLAVEEGLSDFPYELNTGSLPTYVKSEGDFLDYFLMEKREGYCVHFATAFCILARHMGYPARVIQGYKVRVNAGETVVITDDTGHTWPEVYFKGKGWIPFEPTPGMDGERYAGWEVSSGQIRDYSRTETGREGVSVQIPDEEPESEDETGGFSVPVMMMLMITGVAVVSLALLFLARILIKRRKLSTMDEQERFCREYEMVMRYLTELGVKKEPAETLSEFSARADIPGFEQCIEAYEAFAYGSVTPTAEDTLRMFECRKTLDDLMKDQYGRTYFWHKFKLWL
ncbi:MAG: hypothetical protein K6G81_00980 [Lachnospiraceae bacterium]|nr:hypothetical protein [Lachnospiraceae bacterium]